MKKQIQQFSKYACWLMICTLVICIIPAGEIAAQVKPKSTTPTRSRPTPQTKSKPVPQKKVTQVQKIYWYVDFTVTIIGNGEKRSEDGELVLRWSIDRTYSGVMKLNSGLTSIPPDIAKKGQAEIMEAVMTDRFTLYQFLPTDLETRNDLPMHVKIADVLNTYHKSPGEGSSFENSLTITSWKTDKPYNGQNGLQLGTDNKLRTYNVSIPILFASNSQMTMQSQRIVDRSEFGYGGAPTHEESPVQESMVSLSGIRLPTVDGLIMANGIKHKTTLPWSQDFFTKWTYDSGDMEPDKPMIDDVPDSKTNVKVRVRYTFSTTPIY